MFSDDIFSAAAPARASSSSAKPSPLEEEVVGLFDQLQDRLLRYLLSLGLPAAEGEEIVQETFLALFQHLQRGKPRHNLRGWVFQVAHNLALKQRKATQRNRQNLLEHSWTPADRAPDPEQQVATNQRQVRLASVLQALPEQDRRCLSLRAEGLTYREIAQVLEMSLGSVSLSLGRSLARFARADQR
jgi:RNA polymerase sigma-70 factor (ECF subfamily)